ncbi:MAG TPA: enoyl-CoA hydratase/isomerase family protein [Steroidobacteraceae bacterium]|nr:enoyl-CoA hydratase/isomerase family protein [Steroidobacteraceae bacterium]
MLDIIEHDQGDAAIREIRLARPPVNALNGQVLSAFSEAVAAGRAAAAIVITGQPGVFSAGLDVPAILAMDRAGMTQVFAALWHAQHALAMSPVPVVFGITGHCPAGGTVLAIHADYRVMSQGEFRLGLNEVQVGLFPGPVIHGAFRRLVGGHAAQLLTRGALIDPATALRVGLVDELCEAAQCAARALAVAREICALPREPMLRTRALARQDLHALFGAPADAGRHAAEFAEMGTEMFSVPATRERLAKMFAKKK